MKAGTLFSGIGAPELAAPDFDWRWCAEIDPFACELLAQRFPTQPNLGDVTHIDPDAIEPVDLVVFGSPCQTFSVAGKRAGMDDPRGDLAWSALELVSYAEARWIVFENVPGLLSSDGGRDFGAILGSLGELGYGFAYRILDAQFFGVPQRRRRVYVIGHLGDWRAAAAVLFEPASLRRDPAPRRSAAQTVAPTLESSPGGGGSNWETDLLASGGLVAVPLRASGCSTANSAGIGKAGDPAMALDTTASLAIAFTAKDHGQDAGSIAPTLRGLGPASAHNGGGQLAIAFESRYVPNVVPPLVARSTRGSAQTLSPGFHTDGHIVAETVRSHPRPGSNSLGNLVAGPLRNCVGHPPRRLTPRECERLQGLPDDWTLIPWRGKPAADGPRYRAIGNSMAVPVMRWILDRIRAVQCGV